MTKSRRHVVRVSKLEAECKHLPAAPEDGKTTLPQQAESVTKKRGQPRQRRLPRPLLLVQGVAGTMAPPVQLESEAEAKDDAALAALAAEAGAEPQA